ncbi:SprT family zinc-dependent metalloprotease [Alteromonas sp. A079]|uniref:SprT family zinc-dependent metalloprotease n=1 Tax=Alteromonas sp. A079 TaxID=3410268 RepID=UPI003BA139EE
MTDAVHCYYLTAEQFFSQPFVRPALTFRRSGKNAGTAFLQQNRINLHPTLFKENAEAFIRTVIPHEISHLLVWTLYGRVKPHGKEWQAVMQNVFNLHPSTTHRFDVSSVTTAGYAYHCECNTHNLTTRRHNKILRGTEYRCRACGITLKRTVI